MAHQRSTSRHIAHHARNRNSSSDIPFHPAAEAAATRTRPDLVSRTKLKHHESPPESPQRGPHFAETTPHLPHELDSGEHTDPQDGRGHGHRPSASIADRLKELQSPLLSHEQSTHPALERVDSMSPSPVTPTWSNLPNKGQLAILAASRFVDFFQMAALQTFMVHQLKSFDPDLSDLVISHQAGVLQGAFTAAQIVTSIFWGRAADQPNLGRKTVLLTGLVGTGFGCIGVGFSRTYGQAVFWRFMSGAINGTVGSARTMVAEITPKPWHPRAFLLLPAAFNVANVAGPILAGLLVDPVVNLPGLFGAGGTFGGDAGVLWMKKHPYAAANLMSTILLFAEAILVHFFLDETLPGREALVVEPLNLLSMARKVYHQAVTLKSKGFRALRETQREGLLSGREGSSFEMDRLTSTGEKQVPKPVQRLPFRRIWTPNVLWTLLSIAIFDFHMGAFANLWILFLATPREYTPQFEARGDALQTRSAFKFASGLAFPPPSIGYAMSIIGFIGVALQFLLYPWANGKYGLMRCFRMSLFLFPLAYYLAPYLALLPSKSTPPEPASGTIVWLGISFVLFLQVAARTFALPASIILLNNSSPHPSVLATIHGIGNACSATFRTVGPILGGYWFGIWTERGIVGMAWWIVATIAAVGCVASFKVRNGSGHEIFLPGEEGDLKEAEAGLGRSGDGR